MTQQEYTKIIECLAVDTDLDRIELVEMLKGMVDKEERPLKRLATQLKYKDYKIDVSRPKEKDL